MLCASVWLLPVKLAALTAPFCYLSHSQVEPPAADPPQQQPPNAATALPTAAQQQQPSIANSIIPALRQVQVSFGVHVQDGGEQDLFCSYIGLFKYKALLLANIKLYLAYRMLLGGLLLLPLTHDLRRVSRE